MTDTTHPPRSRTGRLLARGAVVLALAASTGAVLSMGVLGSPVADTAPRAVAAVGDTATYAGCGSQAVDTPLSVPIWCSSSDQVLVDLSWSTWGARTAAATGEFTDNPCDCDGGVVERYPVAAEFSDPVDVAGTPRYEHLDITFPGARPAWAYRRTMPFLWSDQGFVTQQVLG